MKQFLFLLSVIFLISCQRKAEKKKISEPEFSFPVVIVDTTDVLDSNVIERFSSKYHLVYKIGKLKDSFHLSSFVYYNPDKDTTLGLEKDTIKKTTNNPHNNLTDKYFIRFETDRDKYKLYDKASLEIRIDTTQIIFGKYPVLLLNKDNDTVVIGHGSSIFYLPITVEAKDSTGQWNEIQNLPIIGCSTGASEIILPPDECILTLTPIRKGNVNTLLRLSIGKTKSVPFKTLISLNN